MQLNAGLYFYKYDGFLTTYVPDTASPTDPGVVGVGVNISAPAESYGGELELLYQLTAEDRLGLTYSYSQSRWVDRDPAFAQAMPQDKRAVQPHLFTANYEHRFHLPGDSTLTTRVDGRYIPSYRANNFHVDYLNMGVDEYSHVEDQWIANFTGTWASASGRYSVSAYVRNIFDERYTIYQRPEQSSTAIVRFSDLVWNDPRTYGVVLSAHF
jgi:iron complex outermembrane receptor protein